MARRLWLAGFGLGVALGLTVAWWPEGPALRSPHARSAAEPSRLFSRPLVIRPGDEAGPRGIREHLRRAGFREVAGRPQAMELRVEARAWVLGLPAFPASLFAGASRAPARQVRIELDGAGRVTELRSEDGSSLAQVMLPPVAIGSLYGPSRVDREPVGLHELPPALIDAVLVIEDRRFFDHPGLDVRRTVGALIANLRAAALVEGGSTITQQLVKNLYLTPERSFTRKLREARLARQIERAVEKPAILEAYLNEVYLGQRGSVAVHGVAAAARHWFDRDVGSLSLAECALLAGILRGPSAYSPRRHPGAALNRRNLVLNELYQAGRIDEGAWSGALQAELGIAPAPPLTTAADWFQQDLARELRRKSAFGLLSDRGLRVVTTLDLALQEAAQRAIGRELSALEAEHPALLREGSRLQAALVAIDPRRGDVLALIGGRDRERSSFHRALRSRRQPGSVFKPVVALAALVEDAELDLETILRDEPITIRRPEGTWRPGNYDRRFRGPVTLREAIERSLNVPFVRLGQRVGPDAIVRMARTLGIESPLEPVPALSLGASEVTLLEMTSAYATLAGEGTHVTPRRVQVVFDAAARRVVGEPVERSARVSAARVRLVNEALLGAVERGTGRRLRALGVSVPVAGKTGTTTNDRDAWFIGFLPGRDLVVGVWVGFDDGHSIGLPGSRAALPIFAAFLKETHHAER